MKIKDLLEDAAGVGLVVPGVNMPKGMYPDEIKRQAKKFGNIVDKHGRPPVAKTNGSDALTEEIWDKPSPKKKSKSLSSKQKAAAKARAKRAGRSYPNLVDNMWASKLEEGSSCQDLSGSNISVTGNEKADLQKEKNIRPGTPEWFRLWFSLPFLTGEKPV